MPITSPTPTAINHQRLCLDRGHDCLQIETLAAAWGYTAHILSRGQERTAKVNTL